MSAAIPPQYVSLIGIPGAGKTTLCRSLAKALGWREFVIGDALRARAASDPNLKAILDRGELAPESIAIDLMREAAKESSGRGLVVDGFPRHRDQLLLALELFDAWSVFHLDASSSIAKSRLHQRLFCPVCNWVGTAENPLITSCPKCGSKSTRRRPEDEPLVLSKRMEEAQIRLADLLAALAKINVVRLDATKSRDEVLREALAALLSKSSAHET
ncbi:MAG: nucleoside monophosphate kinase [Gemmataceae bacterium]|nr:nucleoside monophosphate kinase [Gemmataceae bacterium]